MIYFCYFWEFFTGMAGTGPLFVQVGPPKIAISRGFTTYFKTTGLQLKLLVLIESPHMFHGKSAKKQSGCGHGEKFEPNYRLHHTKNRGVQQSHVLPQNLKAIDVWKVAHHPPSRCVVVCSDHFWKTIVFFLLEWDVQTIIKLKLKQASKEF